MNNPNSINRRHSLALVATAAAAFASPFALAQDFPSKPVRIIVGQAAGGGMDTLARLIGSRLADALKQPVVVENKVGAGGIIGTEFVARAPADGYTLLMGPTAIWCLRPSSRPGCATTRRKTLRR
jgi:tripartite-type tricarboxylate transporter receptor subunit TctC